MSARTHATAPGLVVSNFTAVFGWAVMMLFLAGVAAATWILYRDGPQPGQPAWLQLGAILVFWLGGIVAGWHQLNIPCTRLVVLPDGAVALTRFWLIRREVWRIPRAALAGLTVERGRDGEGDPYWRTLLVLADGREFIVDEGRDAERQRAAAAALASALGIAQPR